MNADSPVAIRAAAVAFLREGPAVLVACESSGTVRDALRRVGIRAISCDLLPTESPGPHLVGDVRALLDLPWSGCIAHPPCTYLSTSGFHWTVRGYRCHSLSDAAAYFFMRFTRMDCPTCIENPQSIMATRYRRPDQTVQPYQFGHDASKATCFWLHGLPPLMLGATFPPRMVTVNGKTRPRWSNQTDSGQNRLPPSADRWRIRSATFPGIAQAMAEQWAPVFRGHSVCTTVASFGRGIATAAPRQVIPGCKSQPGI